MTPEATPAPRRAWPRLLRRVCGLLPDLLAFAGALVCAAVAALLVSIVGCGGGGGVGTEGTGSFASGPISGFGSIVVNGVHYDVPAGTPILDDDGVPTDETALQLGTVVQLRAGVIAVDADGISRTAASEVRTARAIVGAVSAVDAANARLTVLGQEVAVSAGTVFGSGWSGGVASVPIGQWVEVYGDYDSAAGAVQATRIAATPSGTALLRATVGTIDAANRTFTVGRQTYSYAALADPGHLAVGAVVKLALAATPDAHGDWVVHSAQPPGAPMPPANASVDLRGTVSWLESATRFRIDNRTIDAANARIDGALRVGASVHVIGTLQDDSVIASRVEVIASGGGQNFELLGPIASIDTAAHRFVVRGTTVEWTDGTTVFDRGTADSLRVGRLVRVDGALSGDRQSVLATLIRFGN